MKYCKKCNVYTHSYLVLCPLCGDVLENACDPLPANTQTSTPKRLYPNRRLCRVLTVIVSACLVLNVTLSPAKLWSIFVDGAIILLMLPFVLTDAAHKTGIKIKHNNKQHKHKKHEEEKL